MVLLVLFALALGVQSVCGVPPAWALGIAAAVTLALPVSAWLLDLNERRRSRRDRGP